MKTYATCLLVKGGGAPGRGLGHGERAEKIMQNRRVDTKVQLVTPATAMSYTSVGYKILQRLAGNSQQLLSAHKA